MSDERRSVLQKESAASAVPNIHTLLFCRISKNYEEREFRNQASQLDLIKTDKPLYDSVFRDHKTLYEAIGNLQFHGQESKSFFALGSFDALCVYRTPIDPSNNRMWFNEIYKDKQNIVKAIRPDLLLHQMHLVSTCNDSSFWNASDDEFPFFLATCVYGVTRQNHQSAHGTPFCSSYERNIHTHLEEHLKNSPHAREQILFSVYNGISISDVVVLWRAKDLASVLECIPQIVLSGKARKTLTTICFPMENGRIKESVFTTLRNMDSSCNISLSIRGAIRSANEFEDVRKRLQEILRTTDSYQNFGVNDFTIEADVNGEIIADLLTLYTCNPDPKKDKIGDVRITGHDSISRCCWEIHTDLKKKFSAPPKSQRCPDFPSSILYKEYGKFLENCELYRLDQYPWCQSLRELMATNSNIDRNPVLHGPSYLVYYTLRIINSYFSNSVTDFTTTEKIKSLLLASEKKLLRFVRSWDQLTEQIIRNDDVILGGRNNSHTIHISLPESALDFYHAFLRRVVQFLIKCDEKSNRIPRDFDFDLLLVPDKEPRFRFSPLFVTDTNQKPRDPSRQNSMVWPEKQAYLLELPMESIFSPMNMLIPVIHECCHGFGDVLRKRHQRRKYMSAFVASDFIAALEFGSSEYLKLHKVVTKLIYGNPAHDDYAAFYMKKTYEDLKNNLAALASLDGSKRILKEYPSAFFLFSDKALKSSGQMSNNSQSNHPDCRVPHVLNIVDHAKYFFRECYADAMTIALLDLKPEEYLERFIDEIRRFDFDNNSGLNPIEQNIHVRDSQVHLAYLAQRIAIVIAACNSHRDKLRYFTRTGCSNAISAILEWPDKDSCTYATTYKLFAHAINMIVQTLWDDDKRLECADTSTFFYKTLYTSGSTLRFFDACHPPASLRFVHDYLYEAIQELFKIAPALMTPIVKPNRDTPQTQYLLHPAPDNPEIPSLAGDFHSIIREGQMFSQRFYHLIQEYHADIQNEVKHDLWPIKEE